VNGKGKFGREEVRWMGKGNVDGKNCEVNGTGKCGWEREM